MENFDTISYYKFVAALAFVIAAIYLFAFLAKKMGLGTGQNPFLKSRRLNVIETIMLDTKNKVVLIRCDHEEHLLCIGPNNIAKITTQTAKDTTETPLEKEQKIEPFLSVANSETQK